MSSGAKAIGAAGVAAVAAVGGRGVIEGGAGFSANSGRAALHDTAIATPRALELPRLYEIPTLPEIPRLPEIPQLRNEVTNAYVNDAVGLSKRVAKPTDKLKINGRTNIRAMNQKSISAAIQDNSINTNSNNTSIKIARLYNAQNQKY